MPQKWPPSPHTGTQFQLLCVQTQHLCSYAVVLLMSWTLCSGSIVSGHRRIQGAKTIAKALADIRLVSSCKAILKAEFIIGTAYCETFLCILSPSKRTARGLAILYLTRWKMRRSRVFRCVLLSWSITEYTPLIISFLSCKPEEGFTQEHCNLRLKQTHIL